jgi:hypothetical protein
MLIYNVTTHISWPIHEAWLSWMQQHHLPAIMAAGCFEKYQIVRLLDVDDSDGPTYAVQFYCSGLDAYHRYIDDFAPELRNEALGKWGDQAIAFRTLMELVG